MRNIQRKQILTQEELKEKEKDIPTTIHEVDMGAVSSEVA